MEVGRYASLFSLWSKVSCQSEPENLVNSILWFHHRLPVPGTNSCGQKMTILRPPLQCQLWKVLLEVKTHVVVLPRVTLARGRWLLSLAPLIHTHATPKRGLSNSAPNLHIVHLLNSLITVSSETVYNFTSTSHCKTWDRRKGELNRFLFLWVSTTSKQQHFTLCPAQTQNWGASLLCLFEMPLGLPKSVFYKTFSGVIFLLQFYFFLLELNFWVVHKIVVWWLFSCAF